MRSSIVGSGYLGTTVAACLADCGYRIVNVDIDEAVVSGINDRVAPVHELGLNQYMEKCGGKRLSATMEYDATADTKVTLLPLPTPSTDDESFSLSAMKAADDQSETCSKGKKGPPCHRQEYCHYQHD